MRPVSVLHGSSLDDLVSTFRADPDRAVPVRAGARVMRDNCVIAAGAAVAKDVAANALVGGVPACP